MKAVVFTTSNVVLTQNCFNIIYEACQKAGYDTEIVNWNESIPYYDKDTLYFVSDIFTAMRLMLKGYKNIAIWFQGIYPEETLMLNGSKFKYWGTYIIEKYVLKHARYCVFVSVSMKEHYEKKYKISFLNRYTIMPCFNCKLDINSFYENDKYLNNVFAYVGGLTKWQCFEKTMQLYKIIEDSGLPNTSLIVLTKDQEAARKIIDSVGINNYRLGFVSLDELSGVLSKVKYGFILREDNAVNNVATPTKLSTYVANGIFPIYSECIKDFHSNFVKTGYGIGVSDFSSKSLLQQVWDIEKKIIDGNSVYLKYKEFFDNYYSNEKYEILISELLYSGINTRS